MVISKSIRRNKTVLENPVYQKPIIQLTKLDKMIEFIREREMTLVSDLTDEFGENGHTNKVIRHLHRHKNIIVKKCPTGRCKWFEYKS